VQTQGPEFNPQYYKNKNLIHSFTHSFINQIFTMYQALSRYWGDSSEQARYIFYTHGTYILVMSFRKGLCHGALVTLNCSIYAARPRINHNLTHILEECPRIICET
jgi:hypothetical protein